MTEHITEPRDSKVPQDDPPGALSGQNGEENESGHRDDGKHPEPRSAADRPAAAERQTRR